MKKSVLLALAAVALGAAPAVAQEVVYEPDCNQGILRNSAKDNWSITVEGGANMLFGKHDIDAPIKDRIGGNAAIYAGKWVDPNFGFRFGVNWMMPKGATKANGEYRHAGAGAFDNGSYPEKFMGFGPEFDVMINLTNWWCGYRPDRIYNSTVYFGGGAYWTTAYLDGEWKNAHNFNTSLRAGWINSFNVSKAVQLFLDVRFSTFDGPQETVKFEKKTVGDLQAYVGVTYNFNKRTWDAPVVPVCPEVPDCSAIEARFRTA